MKTLSLPKKQKKKSSVIKAAAPKRKQSAVSHIGTGQILAAKSSFQLIQAIEKGLNFSQLEKLQRALGVSLDQVATILGMARATLHRRKMSGRLDPQESDRVMRFARLFDRAAVVLETAENARAWFFAPQRGLGGEKPVNFAQTEVGAREVEDLLERIDRTVYS